MVGLTALGLVGVGVGAAMASVREGSTTVTRDGAVLDGRDIEGYIHIKANNVSVRNSTLRYDGEYAIRVFGGFTGAVIENTKIHCTAAKTHGVVFGNYSARGVHVSGCRNGFVYSETAPATIADSTWNGKPIATGPQVGPVPDPVQPSAGAQPRATAVDPLPPTPVVDTGDTEADGRSAFPAQHNTGVPAGKSLRASGSITVTTDGQVLDGLNINGCVLVSAKDVVIRNSRISCGVNYAIRTRDAQNLLVEDTEIDGQGRIEVAVCCTDYTLRRVEITDAVDGARLGDDTVVEHSWIHHLKRLPGSHNDALQTTGASNIVVRGNSLDAYHPESRDPMNACLMIGSTTGPIVSNLLVEQNYCNGGNYSIGIRTDINASNIQLRANTFGRDYRYGVIARLGLRGVDWDRSTNVFVDSLQPVVN